ncbi:hypothetical protein [Actinophytocola algeriensis]|uniref:Uncharacterized protein n=1 Tax=Actinophytocola algeriensis TaxID=1768010 RepID=A0A7W7Q5E2_9PSEU|nr:hypothetical protein [Actinophytocola algeriensis]MBB4907009.1 hypothetical protein [Actinophytocola algeriensis]MBE1478492.1 hypothetical protein [Actinophytocola algeriensis]
MSRGRKRKPKKSGRGTARPNRVPEARAVQGAERDVYLGDVSPGASEHEVERIMDRRMFVMPYRAATIDGEEFDRLDPADPDQRSLLIQGEHAESTSTSPTRCGAARSTGRIRGCTSPCTR